MALPQGALFWPARRALLVADLHLEKASWFAQSGQMLPPYDSIATLADLTLIAAATAAEEIWCLGDSFHDRHGCDRLPGRGAGAADRAHCEDALDLDHRQSRSGLRRPLRRDDRRGGGGGRPAAPPRGRARRTPARAQSGHFHPKLRISHRGRLVSRRCFVATARKLILPAFGALTGGLDAHHPEIVRAVGPGAEALVPVRDKLLRFPIAA